MTRFERDFNEIKADSSSALEIMKGRKAEIQKLEKRLRETRNGFVVQCTMQELTRLRNEYKTLDELV